VGGGDADARVDGEGGGYGDVGSFGSRFSLTVVKFSFWGKGGRGASCCGRGREDSCCEGWRACVVVVAVAMGRMSSGFLFDKLCQPEVNKVNRYGITHVAAAMASAALPW